MFRFLILCMAGLTAAASSASAQSFGERSTLNLGVGGTAATGATDYEIGSSPALNLDYEFRISKYFAVDGGDEIWFPKALAPNGMNESILYGTNLVTYFAGFNTPGVAIRSSRQASNMLHAGIRGILPLAHKRVELFLGAGPAIDFDAVPPFLNTGAPVFDIQVGGRVALDGQRRFWLGVETELIGNWNRNNQQWVATTMNFGYRFGRGK